MIIPFFIPHAGCPHQCVFCNQKKITGTGGPPDPANIPPTIERYLSTSAADRTVQVAFYGGSFTAIPRVLQAAYLESVLPFILRGQVRNVRISTRPDGITDEIAAFLMDSHVTTMELGAQSMDDSVLALSQRGHTAARTREAVTLLRRHNVSVGLQLMPGLPGDAHETFINTTVKRVVEMKPDFVRIYPALVIKGTLLEELYRAGRYTPLSLDEAAALCREALGLFADAGIDVIRVGLQPTEELERPGTIVAGPYHPAFRQLVDSSAYLDRMRRLLRDHPRERDSVILLVHPSDLSAAKGLRKANITRIRKEFGLKHLNILPDPAVPRHSIHPSR
jgi:histone acetyltransferase (RNA polymerase elongator complex component)